MFPKPQLTGDMFELDVTFPYEIGDYTTLDKMLGFDDNAFVLPFFDTTDEEDIWVLTSIYDEDGVCVRQ